MSRSALALTLLALAAALAALPALFTSLAGVEGLAHLPLALAVIAACAGYGSLLLRFARCSSPWAAVAVGAVVVGHVQLVLGHAGLFGRATSVAVVVVGVALCALHSRSLIDASARLPRIRALWAFGCAPFVAAALFLCAAPPAFYDALVYHVALVEQAIARGALVVTPHDMFTALPFAAELATGTAYAVAGAPEAMNLVQALLFIALIVGAADTAAALFDDAAVAGPTALIVASMPLPLFLAVGTKPDLLTALLFLVALRALAPAPGGAARVDARLLALALGCAFATKLSAIVGVAGLGVALLALPVTRRALLAHGPRALLTSTAAAAALALPAYVVNLLALGNPVFPFASSIFGGPAWLPTTTASLNADAQRVREWADIGELLARPFFTTDPTANELLGLLPLLGLLAFALRRSPAVVVVGVAMLASLPVWLMTHALPRHDPLLWLGLAILGGAAVARVVEVRALAPVIGLVIAAVLVVNASWSMRANEALLRKAPSASLLSAQPRDTVMRGVVDLWPATRAAGAAAGRDGCVFLASGEPRIAGLDAPAVLSEVYAQPPIARFAEGGDVDTMLTRIRGTGATHVLIGRAAPALYGRRGWRVDGRMLAAIIERWPTVFSDETAVVVQVPDSTARPCAVLH